MAKKHLRKGTQHQPAPSEPINQIKETRDNQKRRVIFLIVSTTALALSLSIYILRLDKVIGLVVDDAWYVLLAKALATGQGYTLINSPSPGIRPFYAPAFPALLSIFYRISPNFPNNILLLKSVSITAMIGLGFVAFIYFKRYRELPVYVSLGLALATIVYPALVFLATSTMMSECVYAFVLMTTVVLIERGLSKGKAKLIWPLLGGVLASFAFLTRPAGLGLIIGVALYLLKEKMRKHVLIFLGVVVILVGPWVFYSRHYTPTPEQRAEQGANIVQTYASQFWQRTAGQPLKGTITLGDLPERIWNNLSEIGKYDFGAIVFYPLFRPLEPGEPIRIGSEGIMISLALTVLAISGFVFVARQKWTLAEIIVPLSIGITIFWGWEQYRLLLPLVPFLLFYLLMGVRMISHLYERLTLKPSPRGVNILLHIVTCLLVVINTFSNYQYIDKKYDPIPEYRVRWISAFKENEEFFRYISENVSKGEVIVTQNPALVHLYTGHKTVAFEDPAGSWETWNRIGVRYLARTSPFPLPKPDANESKYRTIYRASGQLGLRLVDLGSPSSRPPWGS